MDDSLPLAPNIIYRRLPSNLTYGCYKYLPFEVPNGPIPTNMCQERSLNKEMAYAFNTTPAEHAKSVTCVSPLGQPTSSG